MKLRFGPFVLDSDARQLLAGGEARRLTPKAFALLELLVDQRPRAVSKQQILEGLWPGTFVAESNVPTLINEVRAALQDDGHRPRYVRTVHRFGYAFCGAAAPVGRDGDGHAFCLFRDQQRFELQPGANVLGRTSDASVVVDHSSVSRRHAVLRVEAGQAVIEDCESKNGTFLRGQRVLAPCELADGDEILLGAVLLLFRVVSGDATTTTHSPSAR
jgi:DNA-binding winged helix-turn-helix (wHTH) protein